MLEQIQVRRSVRKYLNKTVEDEKILRLLEGARLAPSGSNTQPWHFIVVKGEAAKMQLAAVSRDQKWMLSAPVFIVCVADVRSRVKEAASLIVDEQSPEEEVKQIIRDTAIAIEHLVLGAVDLGLGTCWVAWYRQNDVRPILQIPSDKYVVGIITLGYPGETPDPRPRKKLEEIIHYENW
ncbi:MAG TPA: nitroreductase family protein [Selenomonadales bacterium]|nr:nitroreductase family protein [Selenomonadales bacterium]